MVRVGWLQFNISGIACQQTPFLAPGEDGIDKKNRVGKPKNKLFLISLLATEYRGG